MDKLFGQAEQKIADYVERLLKPEDEVLKNVRAGANALGIPEIHVCPFDGLHLEVITRAVGAKKIVEIGTLAGYSGICFLRGMPSDGKLFTFERSELQAKTARENFKKAGFESQVELHFGAALNELPKIEKHGPFDLVFIDADKSNYVNYLEWAATHLRVGGTLLADNTFAWNLITESTFADKQESNSVTGLQRFNERIALHERFRTTMLPTGEGLTMAVKVR